MGKSRMSVTSSFNRRKLKLAYQFLSTVWRWKCWLMVCLLVSAAGFLALFVQLYSPSLTKSRHALLASLNGKLPGMPKSDHRHRVSEDVEADNSSKLILMHSSQNGKLPSIPKSDHRHRVSEDVEADNSSKLILMHSFPWWYELKSSKHYFDSCNTSCRITVNRNLIEDAATVVVYSYRYNWGSAGMAGPRSRNQIWVYFAVESPFNSLNKLYGQPQWNNRFNWTMTYRRDSDIYFGYGDVVRPSLPIAKPDFSPLVSGKSKMVAWFVSNCQADSKRGDIASALQKHMQVDIYGKCGELKCDTGGSTRCFDMLSKDYYFYLSFENTLCKDYVTEKLYRMLKKVDIVPVVYGGANYSALFPDHSFIDVQQFPTVKDLADYLKQVASNKTLYESYLSWKNEWQVIEPVPFSFCDLCWRTHHPEQFRRVYENVDTWWREWACWSPNAFFGKFLPDKKLLMSDVV